MKNPEDALSEDKAIIRSARNSIVKIFNCYEKAGYTKIIISGTGGWKDEGWAEPGAIFPPFQILGHFDVVETDPGEIL